MMTLFFCLFLLFLLPEHSRHSRRWRPGADSRRWSPLFWRGNERWRAGEGRGQLTSSPSATSSCQRLCSERTPQGGLSARPSELQWVETGPQRRDPRGTGQWSFSSHSCDLPQLLHTVDVPWKVCSVESAPGQMSGMMVIQAAHSSVEGCGRANTCRQFLPNAFVYWVICVSGATNAICSALHRSHRRSLDHRTNY